MKLLRFFLLNFFIILAFSNVSFAEDNNLNLFSKANNLYKEKKYEQAINLYQQIEQSGIKNGNLFYNTANAYTKINKFGMAKAYYLKAEKYLPRDTDLQTNLQFVSTKVIDKPEAGLIQNLEENFVSYNSLLSLEEIIITFLILWTIMWIMIITKKLNKFTTPKIAFNITAILVCISALSMLIKLSASNKNEAVVIVQEAEIKSGNDQSNVSLFKLHEGTTIKVLEKGDKWSKIEYDSNKRGWIQNSSIYNI